MRRSDDRRSGCRRDGRGERDRPGDRQGPDARRRALAAELGPHGIRVNAICPGLIDTPLTSAYVRDAAMVEALRVRVPLGRAGTPEEVADVAAFLAGDASRYLTGVVLPVDGGFTAIGTFGESDSAVGFTDAVSVTDG